MDALSVDFILFLELGSIFLGLFERRLALLVEIKVFFVNLLHFANLLEAL